MIAMPLIPLFDSAADPVPALELAPATLAIVGSAVVAGAVLVLVGWLAAMGAGRRITLRRIREDRCQQPRAEGVEMRWSFQEMGLAPGSRVSVENPYQMPRG